ncbi:unnamed protein product [Rangifer tarandus platyrhynchus]|uniref:Uncharacterized protein n=2 Tax=Rangifer tarandus platyrhynchus TaxID=3082113 RepID=A0ACB0EBT7_RANTA|nr:unnamed protein product [Rangifer tarandus platyrhynchus]CAI9698162.1 unnamed protein product [Rangifer tarandus platyrhynchus]
MLSISRARDSPGNGAGFRTQSAPAAEPGRGRLAGTDAHGPGGSPPTAPARPPSAPHSPAQRLTWEGTGPGLPSRRRERAASRRSGADERAQAAPLQLHLASFRLLTGTAPGSGPSLAPQLPRGRCPRARERRGAACLAAISARRLG